jgi:hypothetical protein
MTESLPATAQKFGTLIPNRIFGECKNLLLWNYFNVILSFSISIYIFIQRSLFAFISYILGNFILRLHQMALGAALQLAESGNKSNEIILCSLNQCF